MSEFFITGKPRGGKSFLATKFLYQTLLDSKDTRPIMTNLALNLKVIAEELKKDLKLEYTPDLSNRIRMLDEAESGEFWLYSKDENGNNITFEARKTVDMRQWKFTIPDFGHRGKVGAWYFIDEVHVYFPAAFTAGESRDKQQADNDLRYFLSQHGKMSIDIIFITQHPEQTSKILRRLAQEFMHVRNLSREPFMGFRIGNLFRYVRSLNSPTSANPAPFASGFEKMDFEKYGRMFDTTAGVGIAGTFIREPAVVGRSLWWLTIPLGCIAFGIYWLVFMAPKEAQGFGAMIGGKTKKHIYGDSLEQQQQKPDQSIVQRAANTVLAYAPKDSQGELRSVTTNAPEVTVTGYCCIMGDWIVNTSDGNTYHSKYGEVEKIMRQYCIVDGKRLRISNVTQNVDKLAPDTSAKKDLTSDGVLVSY